MIQIDKTDKLYTYLLGLGVDDIENEYLTLAENGRYNLTDIKQYYREIFTPSQTQDIDEKELEKILDYYIDIKNLKHTNSKSLTALLKEYYETKNPSIKDLIIGYQLKDVLYLCLNYITLHKEVDIQDAVQVANIGFLIAIEKYNPNSKIDFKDYVVYYVRNELMKEFKGEKNDK